MSQFTKLSRQRFRRVFQPSRVVLAVFPAPTRSGVNIVTICFVMHCSYRPPMVAFAVHDVNWSYGLLPETTECVLAVPGAEMADAAMYCGRVSGATVDKVTDLGLTLVESERVSVPSLGDAVANLEARIVKQIPTGDHVTLVCQILRYGVDLNKGTANLLSVGPDTRGFNVHARHGIHRLAVVEQDFSVAATSAGGLRADFR